MQVSLNLGTINITDMEVATFIQNKSVDEIRALFVNLLKNQIKTHQTDSLDTRLKNLKLVNPQKRKCIREALDSLNKKLEPLIDAKQKKGKWAK